MLFLQRGYGQRPRVPVAGSIKAVPLHARHNAQRGGREDKCYYAPEPQILISRECSHCKGTAELNRDHSHVPPTQPDLKHQPHDVYFVTDHHSHPWAQTQPTAFLSRTSMPPTQYTQIILVILYPKVLTLDVSKIQILQSQTLSESLRRMEQCGRMNCRFSTGLTTGRG